MIDQAIVFRFPSNEAARLAASTLEELGYEPSPGSSEDIVRIHVEREDITSALEIAQAHGGQLIEEKEEASSANEHVMSDTEAFTAAYDMDQIPIPAHLVNEDWPEEYKQAGVEDTGDLGAFHMTAEDAPFDYFQADRI